MSVNGPVVLTILCTLEILNYRQKYMALFFFKIFIIKSLFHSLIGEKVKIILLLLFHFFEFQNIPFVINHLRPTIRQV